MLNFASTNAYDALCICKKNELMNDGFIKVAAAIPQVTVGDCRQNALQIESQIAIADGKGVQIIVFPEMCLTAYTCADLFKQQVLLEEAEMGLIEILNNTRQLDIISIIGMPVVINNAVANAGVVIQKGKILGVVPKTFISCNLGVNEQRWFTSSTLIQDTSVRLCGQTAPLNANLLFETSQTTFAIELGEDLWVPVQPSSTLSLQGAEIIFNLSALNEEIGKLQYIHSLISQQSARCLCGYVMASSGFGESTTDLAFSGNAFIYENGNKLAESKRFEIDSQLILAEIDIERIRADRRDNNIFLINKCKLTSQVAAQHVNTETVNTKEFTLTRTFPCLPFVPEKSMWNERCQEVFSIQVMGLAKRLKHTHAQTAVVGISGGLDSTLALLVAVKTFDKLSLGRKNIIGVTMPGFGTTDRTYQNALNLMNQLGITVREISIKDACIQHFKDIDHDMNNHNVTYENSQARERTQILMDISNQTNGMVIGTGDLSELALGWATYNGDHMSMYSVNGGVPKTLVKHLVKWVAENEVDHQTSATLLDIVDTPISPELIPADDNGNIKQKTEDLVGPYELHDFFLYYFLRYGFRPTKIFHMASATFKATYNEEVIKKWLGIFFRRFFNQQFKRSCLPDGPKIGRIGISPRGDWAMPSDASSALWLKEIEAL